MTPINAEIAHIRAIGAAAEREASQYWQEGNIPGYLDSLDIVADANKELREILAEIAQQEATQ